MTYQELINICKTKKRLKNLNKEQKQQFLIELKTAERFYNNGRDIYQEFIDNKEKIQTQYVLPYILEFTEKITNEKIDMVQVSKGASGGIDVDVDFQGGGREFILEYLKEKYGEDCVINVGTQNTLGMKSAVKDILRFYKIPYEKSNEFSKALDRELTWEENLDSLKVSNYNLYKFYESKKEIFELVPKFIDRPRQCLPWNQNIDVIDENGKEIKKFIGYLNSLEDYISYMDKNGRKQYTKNYAVFPSGKKKIYEITTTNGKKIRASAKHKFFLKNGEIKELKDLKEDDEIIIDNSASV